MHAYHRSPLFEGAEVLSMLTVFGDFGKHDTPNRGVFTVRCRDFEWSGVQSHEHDWMMLFAHSNFGCRVLGKLAVNRS